MGCHATQRLFPLGATGGYAGARLGQRPPLRRRLCRDQRIQGQVRECLHDLGPSIARQAVPVLPRANCARPLADLNGEGGGATFLVNDLGR